MKRMVSAVVPIALTISLVGCSKSQKVVEVVHTSSSNEGSEFSFKDGTLGVNDRAYGSVRAGDKVKFDKAGAVWVNGQKRRLAEGSMGIDLIDLAFRLERHFGVKLTIDQLRKMWIKNEPPDIRVGELFDFVRRKVPEAGVLDLDADADILWPLFQRDVSDALDVELREVTKDKWLAHDLGAE